MTPMPSNVPATPTTVMQMSGGQGDSAEFMPLLLEIYRDAKAIFKTNPVHLFAKGTGGTEYSYYRGHGLEQAVQDIAEQLHNEYMISYRPNNLDEGGFHQITLAIDSTRAKRYQARPGYWLAARVPVVSRPGAESFTSPPSDCWLPKRRPASGWRAGRPGSCRLRNPPRRPASRGRCPR